MPSTLRAFAAALLAAGLALLASAPAVETTKIEGVDFAPPTPGAETTPHDPVPPEPAGFILDQAKVFQPEAAARLSARLTAARAAGVYVYVATFRSLGVPPSKQEEKLHVLGKDFTKAWAAEKVGAILLFDDEGGLMTVDFNPETERRFAGFAVEALLREPLGKIQASGLARDKLERSAECVVDALLPLQAKWIADNRRQLTSNLVMGGIAILGLGLAVFSAVSKTKAPAVSATGTTVESNPPTDF